MKYSLVYLTVFFFYNWNLFHEWDPLYLEVLGYVKKKISLVFKVHWNWFSLFGVLPSLSILKYAAICNSHVLIVIGVKNGI